MEFCHMAGLTVTDFPNSAFLCAICPRHDDVINWKHFPRNWPFVWEIHRSPVNSPHKGQWRGALMLSLICVWINDWVNNREAGDLRRYCAHSDVIVMGVEKKTSWHGNVFSITGTGHRWIPLARGQQCGPLIYSLFLAWTNWHTAESPVIWDTMTLMWRHIMM